jgi:hypothetical protein
MLLTNAYIWKDYEVNLGAAESVDFVVEVNPHLIFDQPEPGTGTTIYSGKAIRKPGDTNCKVIINDICADYLKQTMMLEETFYEAESVKNFIVCVDNVVKGAFKFHLDYSFDYELAALAAEHLMVIPIDGLVDYRMPLITTIGAGDTEIHTYNNEKSFNNDFNNDFQIKDDIIVNPTLPAAQNMVLGPGAGMKGKVFEIVNSRGTTIYTCVETCAKYALYYVNEFGGWDFLIMQGGGKKTDEYKRLTTKKRYNNSVPEGRGFQHYANEITQTYELKTGLLTDAQAGLMHHLTGSNLVYMFDIDHQIMYPVLLVDNSFEYKTYRNQGCKMIQYTINVQIAQDITRR